MKSISKGLTKFSLPERIFFITEFLTVLALVIATVASFWSKSWQHGVLFFCLITVVTSLAEKRIVRFFSANRLAHIAPEDRRREFEELTKSPKEWVFRGGSGRWFRNYAIPAVAKAAKMRLSIRAVVVDPRNEKTCQNYAEYRRKSIRYTDHTIKDRGIQSEILATIYALCRAQSEANLTIKCALTEEYSPLRIDANGDHMIITTPDRQIDPIKLSSDHWMYNAFVDEIDESISGGALLIFPPGRIGTGEIDVDHVKTVLLGTKVKSQKSVHPKPLLAEYSAESNVDWNKIVELLANTSHQRDQAS